MVDLLQIWILFCAYNDGVFHSLLTWDCPQHTAVEFFRAFFMPKISVTFLKSMSFRCFSTDLTTQSISFIEEPLAFLESFFWEKFHRVLPVSKLSRTSIAPPWEATFKVRSHQEHLKQSTKICSKQEFLQKSCCPCEEIASWDSVSGSIKYQVLTLIPYATVRVTWTHHTRFWQGDE